MKEQTGAHADVFLGSQEVLFSAADEQEQAEEIELHDWKISTHSAAWSTAIAAYDERIYSELS
jgi:hypothetical protein